MPIEVPLLRRDRQSRDAALQTETKETLSELTPVDVFERRLSREAWETPELAQRRERLRACFEQVVELIQNPATEGESAS